MEPRSFLNDPRHWRERAEEARSRADQIAEPQSKNAMLRIAHDYEVLAERAEARASGHSLKIRLTHCRRGCTQSRSAHRARTAHRAYAPGSAGITAASAGIEDGRWIGM